jgi:hypothetical protein
MDERLADERLRELYGGALEARETAGRQRCPSSEAILALTEREGPEAQRLETLDHVMACAGCRRELDLLRALEEAGVRTAGTRRTAKHSEWTRYLPLALAASLVLAVGLVLGQRYWQPYAPEVMRGPAAEVTLLAPATEANTGAPLVFAWKPLPGARRYAVEVLTEDGAAILRAETADTLLVVATSRALLPGKYQWWVRATVADGTERRSGMRRLRLRTE